MLAYDRMKRVTDFLGALAAGAALAPVVLAIGALIRLIDGKPIFFTQSRPGRDAVPFTIYKFRTMTVSPPKDDLAAEKARVTRLGSVLRTLSLDELPQIWNVLRGDLSFVGPRPLLMDYLPLYSVRHARRHEVRPGVSGLAQVSGRNQLSWEAKFDLDIYYVENRSFLLDFKIVLKSVLVVPFGRGVSAHRDTWVAPFKGSFSSPTDENRKPSEDRDVTKPINGPSNREDFPR